MNESNPYKPSLELAQEENVTASFRWRVIPVTLFGLVTVLACIATVFHFSVLAYAALVGTPEGWQEEHGAGFLRDGSIGLVQTPMLAFGTFYLWKTKYARASVLIVSAFLLRTFVVWII